jgi:hypothetical protein
MELKSSFHESFFDEFDFDDFFLDDDPFGDEVFMHQSEHFVFLLQTALHQNLNADNIEHNRGEQYANHNNDDVARAIVEISARLLFPLFHQRENDIIDQFIRVIYLNNVL